MNMAQCFRITGALRSLLLGLPGSLFRETWKKDFLHMDMFHTQPPPSCAAERTQLLSHTHHPAAHCVSMATSRPGPWMLEISARGREGREGERRNIRNKMTQKDSLPRRTPLFSLHPLPERLEWTQGLRMEGL